jgi:hypothetical protein
LILLAVSFFPSFLTKCMSRVCVCLCVQACLRACVCALCVLAQPSDVTRLTNKLIFLKDYSPLFENPSILDASSNAMPAGERPLVMRWKRRRGQRKRKKRKKRERDEGYIYIRIRWLSLNIFRYVLFFVCCDRIFGQLWSLFLYLVWVDLL